MRLKRFTAWATGGAPSAVRPIHAAMKMVPFFASVRAKVLAASLVLLLIPVVGLLFVRELAIYLRSGQEQVATAAVRLVAASLSDRPEINLRAIAGPTGAPSPAADGAANAAELAAAVATALERERIVAFFSASEPETVASLGNNYQPNKQVERILNQSGVRGGRIWVVDAVGQVRGLSGSLRVIPATKDVGKPAGEQQPRGWSLLLAPISRQIMPHVMPMVTEMLRDADTIPLVMAQAQRAAIGESSARWRMLPDKVALLSVAAPIWQQDNIVAAVVIEETDAQYRNVAKGAAESVITITLIVFIVVFGVLVAFVFRLATRLSRLQREANRAIDPQGRVRGDIRHTHDRDEIGALHETLRAMVARQAGYNSYLEQLAARLSHELRTPVAVVRSSLDNLRDAAIPDDDRKFLARADEGVARLSQIISRMSEATQLERMLQGAHRQRVDVVALVGGCVAGYQQTFLSRRFLFSADTDICFVDVAPDTIAQMLDKMIENAIDFATVDTPITLRVLAQEAVPSGTVGRNVAISIENKGPLLPGDIGDVEALFDSMVSKRAADHAQTNAAHLGLGLYIARLIAEFHHGSIRAENLPGGDGVKFSVTLSCSRA